jgi:hypothetical protein
LLRTALNVRNQQPESKPVAVAQWAAIIRPGAPLAGGVSRCLIKEDALSSRQKYLKILSNLAPAGAQGLTTQEERVSERLAAIREAVSVAAEADAAAATPEERLAWGNWGWGGGWRGGWGFPNWGNGFPNFRNWGNGWGNGWRY